MSELNIVRRRRAIRRGLMVLLLVVLSGAAFLYLYSMRDKPPAVRTAVLSNGDITSVLYLTAQIKPGAVQESSVGRQLVASVRVKPGDQVKKGDLLISFDLTELEEQLAEARLYRQEAEDAVKEMTEAVTEQTASSMQALQDLQYQINRLSGNLSGSISALGSLTGLQPYTVTVDDALIRDLADQLMAVDRDAPDTDSQYRVIIADYSEAILVEPSDDYQKQLDRLQSNLNSASRSLSAVLGGIASPELLAAMGGTSSFGGQTGFTASVQEILGQAIQAEVMAEQALQGAVETITAEIDGVVALVDAVAGTYTGSGGSNSSLNASLMAGLGTTAGSLASAQQKVIVIYDNTRPVATYQANRYDASRLLVGQPVVYRQDGREYYGEITYKSKFALSEDPASGSTDSFLGNVGTTGLSTEPTLAVEMSIRGDQLTDLILGFNIDAEIQTAFAQDVLLLPAEAMKRELGQYYVFVVDEDSLIHRQVIVPGIQSDTHVEVLEGLSAGVRVVLSPANELSDGMLVIENDGTLP